MRLDSEAEGNPSGTRASLEGFCMRHLDSLVGTLTLYCGQRDVAEELAQESLARACRDWNKVRKLDNPDAWLYRVAFNLANSYFRRKLVERRATKRLIGFANGVSEATRFAETLSSRLDLRNAVKRIPARPRQALILRYYVDLPIAAVAELLDCPEGTAKTLIHRAILSLRKNVRLVEVPGGE